MQLTMATASGFEHGLLKKLPNSVKAEDGFKNMEANMKVEAEKRKKEDAKIVRAQYVNREDDNGILEKPYCRYAGEPIQIWRFINGYEYDVPKGLIDEVNASSKPQRAKEEADRKPVVDGRPKQVHQFVPVSW